MEYFHRMKSASVHELKQELLQLKSPRLTELCLRLARFKKENKELLTYLLFEAQDEAGFIRGICREIDEDFAAINLSHLYFAKKSLRKIVRTINKYTRYSGNRQTEVELRLYFCKKLIESGIPISQNAVIENLFRSQVKKIHSGMDQLHEDIRYDYRRDLAQIEAH